MKTKRTITVLLAMGLLLALLGSLTLAQEEAPQGAMPQAQVYDGFTYQGRLLEDDLPADGEYDVQYRLYDVSSGGTPLDSMSDDLIPGSDGLFTVRLGFGSQYFTGGARYLEIALRPSGSSDPYTTLSPRQELTAAPYALALPGLWTGQNTTSPNIIGGYSGNSVSSGVWGAVIGGGGEAGEAHTVTDSWNTIGGGWGNQAGDGDGNPANGRYATIGGGENNVAAGHGATIGGGGGNEIAVYINYATIGGGEGNQVSADQSTIGGGLENSVSGEYATLGGGMYNEASADYAVIGGGGPYDPYEPDTANRVLDDFGTIGGGADNQAGNADGDPTTAKYATVSGGLSNEASGPNATVGGGENNTVAGEHATIAGGYHNAASGSRATVGGGYWNSAGNQYATVGGGWNNSAGNQYATVGGGYSNDASGSHAIVAGGYDNTAAANYATAGGGYSNDASGQYATIGGGNDNTTNADYATVAGGNSNTASGQYATISGGRDNTASGLYATAPWGRNNQALGDYSLAAGRNTIAHEEGCFVWGDSTNDEFAEATVANSWVARASGGVWFYTDSNMTLGVRVSAGGGSWSSVSDRNLKENVEAVDPRAVLEEVAAMPVSTWNYLTEDTAVRHMGPMAQDFYAAFELGDSERYINSLDADGVALAAIQGLYAENQELQARVEALEARLSALEKGEGTSTTARPGGWWLLGGLVVVGGVLVQRRWGGGQ
jgi:hypothetical protein